MIRLAELSGNPKHFRWNFIHNPNFNLREWYEEEYWVWDSDTCGECTSFWVLIFGQDPPTYYKISHGWWQSTDADEESSLWVNEVNVFQVTKDNFVIPPAGQDLHYTMRDVTQNLRFVV